jgi:phosphatidylethanolamine-binding protein
MLLRVLSAVVLSFFGSLVNAQDIGIPAIEAHFTQAGLVPNLLPTFNPSSIMTVNFPGVGAITPGEALTKDREHHAYLSSMTLPVTLFF